MAKWWARNLASRSLFALKHPNYTLGAIARDLLALDERFIARLTGTSPSAIRRFLNEPFEQSEFLSHLRAAEELLKGKGSIGSDFYGKRTLLPYVIVRAHKPELVVETGVGNGVSSTYVLEALHRNGRGSLHSIEIGNSPYVPAGRSAGWIVPDYLHTQWSLHLCDARMCLPGLLDQLGTMDIFIHDSLHTYEHMKFEFEEAYPHLRANGFLISDDASWNSAFAEFVQSVALPDARVIRGVGILQKRAR